MSTRFCDLHASRPGAPRTQVAGAAHFARGRRVARVLRVDDGEVHPAPRRTGANAALRQRAGPGDAGAEMFRMRCHVRVDAARRRDRLRREIALPQAPGRKAARRSDAP